MFTREHYNFIAALIREYGESEPAHIKGLALHFGHAFEQESARFKLDLFLGACGMDEKS